VKTVASRHKCGDTIPKKTVLCRFLANFFLKNREFATEYSVFRKLCRHLAIFAKNKITAFDVLTSKFAFIFILFYVVRRYVKKIG
jgi:hypothetical protein